MVEPQNHLDSSIFNSDLDPLTESDDEGQKGEKEEKGEPSEEEEGKSFKRRYGLVSQNKIVYFMYYS